MHVSKIFMACTFMVSVAATGQNVGIGTTAPLLPLDVAGRIHFKHNNQNTPGIYFDGQIDTHRGFLGHADENHIGLYGVNSGWMLAMNFYTGNTSIGHALPTATLDVLGSLRLRIAGAGIGYTLNSADANGNAEWERPIAFKASGAGVDGNVLPTGQWIKASFSNIPEYNIGLAWEPINQDFVVPVRGVYHFDGHFQGSSLNKELAARLLRIRNGTETDIHTANHRYQRGSTLLAGYTFIDFSVDVRLEAGDRIRVELRSVNSENDGYIDGQPSDIFFSGRLVSAL